MISASKKIDYGILLMASLPEHGEQQFRSLQDVAQEKKLSAGFLSQVMIPLKKAGLVQSKEGVNGGYQLSKPSRDISLSEIYEAIEGPLKLTACQDVKKACVCEKTCPTKGIWTDLQGMMSGYLQKRNLSEFRNS
jgi:Rrf2 family protein